MLYVLAYVGLWLGLILLCMVPGGKSPWEAEYDEPLTYFCPYCGDGINGTLRDIDSGLRKHLDYCDVYQALDH